MNKLAALRVTSALVVILGMAGCHDDGDDVTGSRGSLAVIEVEAPDSARSGDDFRVDVTAGNVGVSNIRNGRVEIALDAPLSILSVETSPGTSASVAGNRIIWDLGTLDSNSRSRLNAQVMGVLSLGEASRTATIRAELFGQAISAGDAVATDTVTINP
ncbi:MAG TPA: hypothetical protein VF999_07425 [Thermoanaerobaculia bacterium]